MRLMTVSFASFSLVFAVAVTAFGQDAVPAEPTAAPAEPTSAPAEVPATVDTSPVIATEGLAPSGRFVVGARLGYAVAMGKAVDETDGELSKGISGHIPIWLDLGYLVTPNIMVGLYGQYGIGFVGSGLSDELCDPYNLDCSARVIRFGIQGQYHLSPAEKLDPWFGVGFGYELATMSVSGSVMGTSIDSSATYKGFEFLNLQGGADFKVSPAIGIGPFLSFSLGQYGSASTSGNAGGQSMSDSGDIDNTAIHEWFTFGVRGAFTL
jgi:outer membrane protein W